MILEKISVVGAIEENAYFYVDESTGKGVLIDPGAEANKLAKISNDNGWTIEKILITHGHFDHIGAVEQLHRVLNVPYFAHVNSEKYLTKTSYNLSAYSGQHIILKDANYFENGEIFSVGNGTKLRVIHTPGHTEDSVVFYDAENGVALVGDTIFKNSVGAVHFPGGDARQLADSVFNCIFQLPDETVLYSGHTDATTVLDEKNRYKNRIL